MKTKTRQATDKELWKVQEEFGNIAYELAKRFISCFGIENINLERLCETTRGVKRLKDMPPGADMGEAIQYEIGYMDHFLDLKNSVIKGGYQRNKEAIDRMLAVGVKVPKSILRLSNPPVIYKKEHTNPKAAESHALKCEKRGAKVEKIHSKTKTIVVSTYNQ